MPEGSTANDTGSTGCHCVELDLLDDIAAKMTHVIRSVDSQVYSLKDKNSHFFVLLCGILCYTKNYQIEMLV